MYMRSPYVQYLSPEEVRTRNRAFIREKIARARDERRLASGRVYRSFVAALEQSAQHLSAEEEEDRVLIPGGKMPSHMTACTPEEYKELRGGQLPKWDDRVPRMDA